MSDVFGVMGEIFQALNAKGYTVAEARVLLDVLKRYSKHSVVTLATAYADCARTEEDAAAAVAAAAAVSDARFIAALPADAAVYGAAASAGAAADAAGLGDAAAARAAAPAADAAGDAEEAEEDGSGESAGKVYGKKSTGAAGKAPVARTALTQEKREALLKKNKRPLKGASGTGAKRAKPADAKNYAGPWVPAAVNCRKNLREPAQPFAIKKVRITAKVWKIDDFGLSDVVDDPETLQVTGFFADHGPKRDPKFSWADFGPKVGVFPKHFLFMGEEVIALDPAAGNLDLAVHNDQDSNACAPVKALMAAATAAEFPPKDKKKFLAAVEQHMPITYRSALAAAQKVMELPVQGRGAKAVGEGFAAWKVSIRKGSHFWHFSRKGQWVPVLVAAWIWCLTLVELVGAKK